MAKEDKEALAYEPPKIRGGVYRNAEGEGFHNANGDPVDEDGELLEADAPAEEPVEETDDWKDEMEAQKTASAEGTPAKGTRRRRRGSK